MSEPSIDILQSQSAVELSPRLLRKLRISIPGFHLDSVIGRGGQAVVLKAIQQSTGQVVAIKLLREGRFADEAARERLQREVVALATLNHPNIVGIIDRGVTPDGYDYVVMNFIAGLTLKKFLADRWSDAGELGAFHSVDPTPLLKLFSKICQAVDFAHQRGIIHRDLCPSNILIDERGEPQILDFGLARMTFYQQVNNAKRTLSVTGEFLGKLAYASPEVANGEHDQIQAAADVYALGVILYEILTGEYPYKVEGSYAEILNHINHSHPTPPSELIDAREAEHLNASQTIGRPIRAAISTGIEAIVLKALAKAPAERYPSAGELSKDIDNYLAGLPTIVRFPINNKPSQKAYPSVWNVALTAISLIMLLVSWSWVHGTIDALSPGKSVLSSNDTRDGDLPSAVTLGKHRQGVVVGKSWQISGDELVFDSEAPVGFVGFGNPEWSEFDLRFKTMTLDELAQPVALFPWVNYGKFYVLRLGTVSNPSHRLLHRCILGENAVQLAANRGKIEPKRWHQIRVEIRGSAISCFVNGELAIRVPSAELHPGCVGIAMQNGTGRFRDIEVIAPDGKVLWRGLPDLTTEPSNIHDLKWATDDASAPQGDRASNPSDSLQVGSVWTGRERAGGIDRLEITSSSGETFTGRLTLPGRRGGDFLVEGTIRGDKLHWWCEHSSLSEFAGTIDRDVLTMRPIRFYEDRGTILFRREE